MKDLRLIPVALVLICCLFVITGLADASSAPKKDAQGREKCREMIRISRSDNPWQGMTDSYAREQENKNIKAVPIGMDDATIPALDKYKIGSDRLMVKQAGLKKVVVNEKYFSDLAKADATRIQSGQQQQQIGKYLDKSFAYMTPRKLAYFLLDAQVITTYWHIEAELCLEDEVENEREYRAHFTGRHIYYTNRRNEEKLDFVIRIDKATGEMILLGN
jgi:hypothetical protein